MNSNLSVRSTAVKILNNLVPNFSGYKEKIQFHRNQNEYSESDNKFLYKLVNGTIIYKKLLDYIIDLTYNSSISQLEHIALNILRIGAYQKEILGTPPHAYVYETVECAKELKRSELTGLINGVLRNLPDKKVWSKKLNKLENSKELALRYSHPDWLVQKWQSQFGTKKTKELLQFNNNYVDVFFRHNPLKLSWQEFQNQLTSQQDIKIVQEEPVHFFKTDKTGRLLRSKHLEQGYCSVQDISQSLPVMLLNPKQGEKIIDACAAPGGKSSYISQIVQNDIELIQSDVSEQRLELLEKNMEQLGVKVDENMQANATTDEFPLADKILLDVPCSGTGVTARKSDLRWNRNAKDIDNYASIQLEMLLNMAKFVKEEGYLLYSTCSLEPEENWEVIEKFLTKMDGFTIVDARTLLSSDFCDKRGAMNIKPFKNKLTGSFAVKMVKE